MARARTYSLREIYVGSDMSAINKVADLLREQVSKSMSDPETRHLAASLVSGTYDWAEDPATGNRIPVIKYHGRWYRAAVLGQTPLICNARDYACEISAIWNFLVLNVRYTRDAIDADVYQDLRVTLESGGSDCDDSTIAFAALLQTIGLQVYARIISLDGRRWVHVHPVVQLPNGATVPLDITEPGKRPGWQANAAAEVLFPLWSEE